LHEGHRELIKEGKRLAKIYGTEFCLVTFDDNLYKALGRVDKELYLLREREEIAYSAGVDEVFVLPGEKSFLDKSAEDFMIFIAKTNPAALVVGEDYTFGRGAKGTANEFAAYFHSNNVPVTVCPLLICDGKKISTTGIKRLLSEGRVEDANDLLTEPYFVSGNVVNGLKNGRKIGLPTANMDFDDKKFVPRTGVYMTKTVVDGRSYASVTNVGTHPTVNKEKGNIETHILDFEENIYGKEIKIEFYKFIRDIKMFKDVDQLRRQICADIKNTRKEFGL
ncbi:MAG: riboflavin biosynthesis protein RibF, partial [Christensenellales bacterium]